MSIVFSDNFNGGTFTDWDFGSGALYPIGFSLVGTGGGYAVACNQGFLPGQVAGLTKTLPVPLTNITVRAKWAGIVAGTLDASLWSYPLQIALSITGNILLGINLDGSVTISGGQAGTVTPFSWTSDPGILALDGSWHGLQLGAHYNGAASVVKVVIDDVVIKELTGLDLRYHPAIGDPIDSTFVVVSPQGGGAAQSLSPDPFTFSAFDDFEVDDAYTFPSYGPPVGAITLSGTTCPVPSPPAATCFGPLLALQQNRLVM